MDPAVVVVQQSPPHHAPPPPQPHPAVTTAMLSNPAAVPAPGITTQTFTNHIFMPPTTLAAMQAHVGMHPHVQQQQQGQQHPADPRPAPGFAGLRPPQPQPMQPSQPPQQPQQPQQQPQVNSYAAACSNALLVLVFDLMIPQVRNNLAMDSKRLAQLWARYPSVAKLAKKEFGIMNRP